jgi:glycosyltransferase involved in cell wall biosynthesis
MSAAPRLSIGLPVYNGAKYLEESLNALLGQSFEDFELIISDNASTDGTAGICRRFCQQDSRIRYVSQPENIGLARNHNFVFEQATGKLFKWASYDDLYARDLLQRCIDTLDENPRVVLAHSWTALVDDSGELTRLLEYPLVTDSLRAPERFKSMLFGNGGDDVYGVVRADILRRTALHGSYHHADRVITTEFALHGPFGQVPDWLYFRRDHAGREERACPTLRTRCANMDPRRADRLRHPAVRLYGEYILGYVTAIRRAQLSPADREECYRYLAQWMLSRAAPRRASRALPAISPVQPMSVGQQRSPR